MANVLQVGVVGYGYWGPKLVNAFINNRKVKVQFICETNEKRLAEASASHTTCCCTSDYNQLLESSTLDAIVIATPVLTHYELAQKALLHNKHILVEKPLCLSVQQAEELMSIAKERGLKVMTDYTLVYTEAVKKIKSLINEGLLGDLLYIDSVRINLGIIQNDVNVIWDLAVHDLSILHYLTGEKPHYINAFATRINRMTHENIAYIQLNYPSGFKAFINCSWISPVKIRKMLIGGTQKMIVYDDTETSEKLKIYNSKFISASDELRMKQLVQTHLGDIWVPELEPKDALTNVVDDFINAIQTGAEPIAGKQFSLDIIEITEAINRALVNADSHITN